MFEENKNIIFVHFLNDQIINIYKIKDRFDDKQILTAIRKAFKYLILGNDSTIYIPTVDIIQSPYFDKIFPYIKDYFDQSIIKFVGAELSTDSIIESKYKHFNGTNIHKEWFNTSTYPKIQTLSPAFIRKNFSTTQDMMQKWEGLITDIDNTNFKAQNHFDSKIIEQSYFNLQKDLSKNQFIQQLGNLRKKLGEHAFLWSVVENTKVFDFQFDTRGRNSLEFVLASLWLQSYISEYNCKIVSTLPIIGDINCNLIYGFLPYLIDLNMFEKRLIQFNIYDLIEDINEIDLLAIKRGFTFQKFSDIYLQDNHIPFNLNEINYINENIEKIKKENITNVEKINKVLDFYIEMEKLPINKKKPQDMIMEKQKNIIGVIIALKEEFRIFNEILAEKSLSRENEDTFYIYNFDNDMRVVATFIGDMGGENASIQTSKFLSRYSCSAIINIGIAGSLDKDIVLGDIIIADQVESYMKVAKATQKTKDNSFSIKLSGETYRPSRTIVEGIDHFEFSFPKLYEEWKQNCSNYLANSLEKDTYDFLQGKKLISSSPKMGKGHVASGDIVAGAEEFVNMLKNKDRKYLAIEMEAGGVLNAIEKLFSNANSLIVRGISDFADERKTEMDSIGDGAIRRYAMYNVVTFLLMYLNTDKEK